MLHVPELLALAEHSAEPAAVSVAFMRLVESYPDLWDHLEAAPSLADTLVAVFGASRSLTQLVLSDPVALKVLAHPEHRLPLEEVVDSLEAHSAQAHSLQAWKRRELLRVAARDLMGYDGLEEVGQALAAMAKTVLEMSWDLSGKPAMAVIGMGKLGGGELNYASDVDVLFVGGSDPAARALLAIARGCFRVDANLRPEGRNGPLTRSLGSYEAYWDRWAQAWEFQALLKARPAAGDTELARAFCGAVEKRLWERPFTAEDLRYVRALKGRAEGEVARRGLVDRELKRGRGGIRDIEFSIQLLQLVHGRHDPGLRSPNTLDALAELSGAGYVDPADAGALEDAYRFLRTVEHRLQLVDEQQVHAVPADVTARTRLARVLGYRDQPEASALEQFDEMLRYHQAAARSVHERIFFRPLLEAFAGAGRLSPAAAEARLAAFGFTDVERTRQAVRELTRRLTRSSRLMQQFLPLLLTWLSESPDPDLGLLGLRHLASGPQRETELVTAFRESPEVARRLCLIVGTSRLLADTLSHNPDLIPALGDPVALAPRSKDALLDASHRVLRWREGDDERASGLQRLKRRVELRIATRDLLSIDEVEATEAALTTLAEAVLQAALTSLEPKVPFAVVAMGRFGGAELSYASDLDVLFVHDAASFHGVEEAERTATRLVRFVNGATPALRIYELDAALRPEGKQGPLARSLDGYRAYYERWAQTWERQALVRARPVAGDHQVAGRFMELVDKHLWQVPLSPQAVRDIRRMKARVERERIPPGDDPRFHLKLGRGSLSDVEWTAQLLQLRHGIPSAGTMAALDALQKAGAMEPDDARILAESYRFCERTRNRLFLLRGSPSDSLPTSADHLVKLARALDTTPSELRERYRRVTRRARAVVERLFYGSGVEP